MTLQAPVLTLDIDKAAQADSGGRISITGGYIGKLTQMKWRSSDSGAGGYVIDFKAADGQVADGIYINTIKRDGTPSEIGENQINALMCCMSVPGMKPVQAQIQEDVFNEALGKYEEQTVNAYIYPEMCNITVGIILQKELTSRISDGADSYRMQFVRSFQASTEYTAAEMIAASNAKKAGKEVPEAAVIKRTLESIEDKDSRNKGDYNAPAGGAPQGSTLAPIATGSTDFDQEFPF